MSTPTDSSQRLGVHWIKGHGKGTVQDLTLDLFGVDKNGWKKNKENWYCNEVEINELVYLSYLSTSYLFKDIQSDMFFLQQKNKLKIIYWFVIQFSSQSSSSAVHTWTPKSTFKRSASNALPADKFIMVHQNASKNHHHGASINQQMNSQNLQQKSI